jgi:hypothetical protein
MVKDSIKYSFDKFKNIIVVTRSKSKYLKKLSRKIVIINPSELLDFTRKISSFSLFIATTNITSDYKEILQQVFDSKNISSV